MTQFMDIFRDAVKNNLKVIPCDDPIHSRKGIEVNGKLYYASYSAIIKAKEISEYLKLLDMVVSNVKNIS